MLHGKIYRKQYLIENKITFSNQAFAEDAYFNMQALLKTDKVSELDYVGYYYRGNEKGITR